MDRRSDCPSWCAEDVTGTSGTLHRVVVGDVRLTRVNALGSRRTMCAVRRRAGRTPAQVARLCENMADASDLLRHELRGRRVHFQDNDVFQDNDIAPAVAEVLLA